MFTVVSKKTGYTYEVYAVIDDEFLIFFNNEFRWQPMNLFRPQDFTQRERAVEDYPLFKSQINKRNYP